MLAYTTTPLESGSRPNELLLGSRLRTNLPLQHTVEVETGNFQQEDARLKRRQNANHDSGRKAKKLPARE